MKANAESRNDKFQGIHALDSQVAKYFRNFRPTSAFYWNNDSFHTKFNSPGMSGVCFYPNMSTFKNQDLYLPQTCSKSNQRNCLQLQTAPTYWEDSRWFQLAARAFVTLWRHGSLTFSCGELTFHCTNSMKIVIPLHFISWKNSFSDMSRKCILPNMIRAGMHFTKYDQDRVK